MNKITTVVLSSLVVGGCALTTSIKAEDWKTCADRVQHDMHRKGFCGASDCSDNQNRSLAEVTTDTCGYPERSGEETARMLEDLNTGWSFATTRAAMYWPPDSEVRRALAALEREEENRNEVWDQERKKRFSIDRVFDVGAQYTIAVVRTSKNINLRCTAIGPSGDYVAVQDWSVEPPAEEVTIFTAGAAVKSVSCKQID